MNELKDWSCEFAVDNKAPLTVGQKFGIQCKGSTPIENYNGEVLIFPNDEKNQHQFVLLKKDLKSPYELTLIATSWKVGNHDYQKYSAVINDSVIELKGPRLQFKSVLEKGSKMNPPPGPVGLMFPGYVKYVGAFLFVLLAIYIIYWFKKNKKYDLALIKLYSLKTSLSPFFELNKKLRALEVKLYDLDNTRVDANKLKEMVTELKEMLTNYLSLTISEPLFIYKENKQVKVLRSKLPKAHRAKLMELFIALQKEIVNLEQDIVNRKNIDVLGKDLGLLIGQVQEFSEAIIDATGWNTDLGSKYA